MARFNIREQSYAAQPIAQPLAHVIDWGG